MSDENESAPKTGPESFRTLDKIPVTILSFLAVLALHSFIVQTCWNHFASGGGPLAEITFFDAVMLLALVRILVGAKPS